MLVVGIFAVDLTFKFTFIDCCAVKLKDTNNAIDIMKVFFI